MKDSIIGHEGILQFFEKAITADRLAHAYCFIGQAELGKRTVAETIAAKLLGITRDKLMIHPDVITVRQEKNEKTDKTKKNIDVDQIRNVRSALMHGAFLGKYKIVIIDGAEKMSIGAANALLKTLEEPKPKTILFLLTTDLSRIPVTIRSRCQPIYFYPVPKKQLAGWLDTMTGLDGKEKEAMAAMARGLPGRLRRWVEDREQYEADTREVERFHGLMHKPLYEKVAAVEDMFGDKTDQIATRSALKETLSVWQTAIQDILDAKHDRRQETGAGRLTSWSYTDLLAVYDNVRRAKELLEKNIHPRLLIEHILLSIP